MDKKNNAQYVIDELASQAGGYFSMPTQEDIAYTDLLFDVCRQFGIRYYSASAKGKGFRRRSNKGDMGEAAGNRDGNQTKYSPRVLGVTSKGCCRI